MVGLSMPSYRMLSTTETCSQGSTFMTRGEVLDLQVCLLAGSENLMLKERLIKCGYIAILLTKLRDLKQVVKQEDAASNEVSSDE